LSIWFAQGSKAVIFVFLMCIWYKYGHIKFGEQYEKPEYSTMIYAAVMAFLRRARTTVSSAQAGYRSQDEVDMFAINMAVNNWGIVCWAHYTLVAVRMSLALSPLLLASLISVVLLPGIPFWERTRGGGSATSWMDWGSLLRSLAPGKCGK
jgi:choline-glycine betaine transporter